MKPLDGLLVVDLSQFLSGPSASLRLADLGARVIKVERPGTGDLCRNLYISSLELDGESTLFHSINRNKESYTADLKDATAREDVLNLIRQADVMIHNFRPGVISRLGLDYESVAKINSGLVYGEISGYGDKGPWRGKPGQDLLIQSLSGLLWLSGNADQPPTPFGIAIADLYAGAHLVQGILACLIRRGITGIGGKVEVSLLESILDFQFEVFNTFLNDGQQEPRRSEISNAHAYLGAPYGVYRTQDGYVSLAMGSIASLAELLGCPSLFIYRDPMALFDKRDEIKQILVELFLTNTTAHWLSLLEPADIWCSDVFTWKQLVEHEGFKALDMVQQIDRAGKHPMKSTRCPIRIDGAILTSNRCAPYLGENTDALKREFATSNTVDYVKRLNS